MAVEIIEINGTDFRFLVGDDSGNFIFLLEDWIDNVSSGNGDDTIIATENQFGLDPGGGVFTKPNKVVYRPDIVDAQGGDDRIIIEASGGTFLGGDDNDRIFSEGPAIGNRITFIYGDDQSFVDTAGHGNDEIYAGIGNEFIDGGGGIDWLFYDNANRGVFVDLGDVNADGTHESGRARGGSGKDELLRIENVSGSDFDDKIFGNNIDNELIGNDGNDNIRGGAGEDIIRGGNGNDNLRGGNDDDELYGGGGNDGLFGGQGNDLLVPGSGDNDVNGGIGFDTVDYSVRKVAIFANLAQEFVRKGSPSSQFEIDVVVSVENVIATQFGDFIFGNGKANNLQGLGGDDAIAGLDNADLIAGGVGNDFLFGNQGSDSISGGADDDFIDGGTDDDFLFGNSGNDALVGGPGSDLMSGDAGEDRFIWRPADFAPTSLDTVVGFDPQNDTLVFAGLIDDPATALASDYLQAEVVGNDTILTFDFDGTPGPSTGLDFSVFVELDDYLLENAQLDLLQFVGAIEFI